MFRSPFKSGGYYVFNYQPRYYNERKEQLETLKKKYHGKKEEGAKDFSIKIAKKQLIKQWDKSRKSSNADRSTMRRMAIIIALLVGMVAYLFGFHQLF